MGMFWRGEHTFAELHALGGDIGAYPPPKLTYYVDKEEGSDGNTGLGSWRNAKATYQAGVTAATCADNKFRDVDLIIAPAEYDEEVELSGIAQGQYNGMTSPYFWRMGRLRVICMGEKVILKNSLGGAPTTYTLNIGRVKVELHGGTFRQYLNSGHISGVHWEREQSPQYSAVKGDVIGGAMYGCRVEGRSSAQVGIHLDAASYVHIEDCWISGWICGVLESANNLGYPLENVLKKNRFRDNTNDIQMGGSQFFLMQDNIHMDFGTTKFISASAYSGHTGTVTDCLCVGGRFNTSGWAKLPAMSGVLFTDVHMNDR